MCKSTCGKRVMRYKGDGVGPWAVQNNYTEACDTLRLSPITPSSGSESYAFSNRKAGCLPKEHLAGKVSI